MIQNGAVDSKNISTRVPDHIVNRIEIQQVDKNQNKLTGEVENIHTDCVLMSGGWNPAVQLFSQSRGKLKYDLKINTFVPDKIIENQKKCVLDPKIG